jgi:hypothetical protein
MLSLIKSKRFLMSLLFGVFGFCGSLVYNIALLFQFTSEALESILKEVSAELIPILISSALFGFIITFISYYVGDILREKLALRNNKIDKKGIIAIFIVGIVLPLCIGVIDLVTYGTYSDGFFDVFYSLVNTSSSIIYNGIIEEIWFRFAFLPFMIFTIYKVFNRNKNNAEIDKKFYLYGLIFTALFLFVFQFAAIVKIEFFSFILLLRLILVYLLPNLVYSGLYLKYNLKVSILAHCLFVIMYAGLVPYVLSYFIVF